MNVIGNVTIMFTMITPFESFEKNQNNFNDKAPVYLFMFDI